MKNQLKNIKVSLSAIIIGIVLAGCGGGADVDTAPAVADDGVRQIRITGNDAMQFNITEIRAEPGEELRIALTNIGRMPKQHMGHNWVLFKALSDSELNTLAMDAAGRGPEHLPADMSAVLAHTRMLGPAESDQITITAPQEPGEYPFACTFPGHFALMRGKLIVE